MAEVALHAADSLLRMAYSKLRLHVILSWLSDGRSQLELEHSLPIEGAGGFRSARRNLVLLAAQSQAPDSQATPLRVDEKIHALCEALVASEGGLGP
jgi:hypothetical protein